MRRVRLSMELYKRRDISSCRLILRELRLDYYCPGALCDFPFARPVSFWLPRR